MRLLITIDTEEEFEDCAPFTRDQHSVENIRLHHEAMMDFYQKHNVKPLMVLTYPVIDNEDSFKFLKEAFDQNAIDIGAHLHPWVTPPYEEALSSRNSYPGNLPFALEKEKLERLTDIIEKKFAYRPTIYKAGRYGIGKNTNKILSELGYHYDLSYFAQRSFTYDGGPDHRHIESDLFKGEYDIQHFPMTMIYKGWGRYIPFIRKMVRNEYYKNIPLRGMLHKLNICSMASLTPENTTLAEMKEFTQEAIAQGVELFQMSFHSSSFTTGAIPTVQTEEDVLRIKSTIEDYILFFKSLGGCANGFFNVIE